MHDGLRGQQTKEASNGAPSVVFWRKPQMHRFCLAAVVTMAGLFSGQAALAQDAAQPVYIVTYTEVAPGSASEAGKLILAYASEARKASGAVQVDALQRISD